MRLLYNRKYFCPIQKSGNVKLFNKKSKDQMDMKYSRLPYQLLEIDNNYNITPNLSTCFSWKERCRTLQTFCLCTKSSAITKSLTFCTNFKDEYLQSRASRCLPLSLSGILEILVRTSWILHSRILLSTALSAKLTNSSPANPKY